MRSTSQALLLGALLQATNAMEMAHAAQRNRVRDAAPAITEAPYVSLWWSLSHPTQHADTCLGKQALQSPAAMVVRVHGPPLVVPVLSVAATTSTSFVSSLV
ncbi:hypothetical protein LB505_008355 [Fusarium chuoi]|nr:hypothetical protein LB505_008355 [Fusarium chuoi]